MPMTLLAGPAAEPLSLAEAKAYLRVEHTEEDDVIAALIAAARVHLERATRRAFITQTWRAQRDRWPADGHLALPLTPLQAVVAASVTLADGSEEAVSPDAFAFNSVDAPASLTIAGGPLPQPGRRAGGITIDLRFGYGDAAADVPAPLRQALRPLAPVHLRARRDSGGVALSWIRRSRIGGDAWLDGDIPLGEASEAYRIEILDGSAVVRTLETGAPQVLYAAADEFADFGAPQTSLCVRVAQLSAIVGAGFSTEAVLAL